MQHIQLRNVKVNQIQIFLEAVHCGSFSGAAESLHVTQPMVSKTIQTLEKETEEEEDFADKTVQTVGLNILLTGQMANLFFVFWSITI